MGPETAVALMMVFLAFTLLMVITRFWILRHRKRDTARLSGDFFLLLTCTLVIILIGMTTWKISRLIEYRKTNDQATLELLMATPEFLKILFASSVIYTTSLWTLKGAFLSFYWSLFKRVHGKVRWFLNGSIGFSVCAFLVAEIGNLAWCRPITTNWSENLPLYASCAPAASLTWTVVAAIVNIINDLVILLIPLSILNTLHFRRREVIALGFVFVVGAVSIIAAITRLVILVNAMKSANAGQETQRQIEVWSIVEVALAIVAFCLPAFRVLFLDRTKAAESAVNPEGSHGSHPAGARSLTNWSGKFNMISSDSSGKDVALELQLQRDTSEECLRRSFEAPYPKTLPAFAK